MESNGHVPEAGRRMDVLRWPGRVLTAEDVRRSLNGHREVLLVAGAVVTPLADEQLRTAGVRVTRQSRIQAAPASGWAYGLEQPSQVVQSALQAVEREGLVLGQLPGRPEGSTARWARAAAETVAGGDFCGGILFCQDAGLLCCVANKVPGMRAVRAASAAEAAQASLRVGANLITVPLQGRTFFEIRQILRTVCASGNPACPNELVCVLTELDGHAHR